MRGMARRNADTIRRTVAYASRFQDGYQQAWTTNIKVDVEAMLAGALVRGICHCIVIMVMRMATLPVSVLVISVMEMAGLVMRVRMHKETGEHPGRGGTRHAQGRSQGKKECKSPDQGPASSASSFQRHQHTQRLAVARGWPFWGATARVDCRGQATLTLCWRLLKGQARECGA